MILYRRQGTPATHKTRFLCRLEFIVLRSIDYADTLKTRTDHLLRLQHFTFPTKTPRIAPRLLSTTRFSRFPVTSPVGDSIFNDQMIRWESRSNSSD
jgi:hypothetical protein